jgi:mannose-6-phosphate isomerase-like protein (cupin superfamily)
MKDLQTWIREGMLERFLQGGLDAQLAAEIEAAAHAHPEVKAAIRAAQENLKKRLIAEMAMQDPQDLIRSGKLLTYCQGGLSPAERTEIELMALVFPEVGQAVDSIKRAMVDETMDQVLQRDPQAWLETGILVDYVFGNLDAAAMQDVELMAFLHPTVAEELGAMMEVDAVLTRETVKTPPARSKQRLMDFMDEAEKNERDAIIIRPPFLNTQSTAADFEAWVSQEGMEPPQEYENLHVVPIDGNPDGLTMVVWVKSYIAEEVHLDSVEKFLVLEGACTIDVEGETYSLKKGDFMSIPKFMRHTVHVTSEIPCKLIVQQVAA